MIFFRCFLYKNADCGGLLVLLDLTCQIFDFLTSYIKLVVRSAFNESGTGKYFLVLKGQVSKSTSHKYLRTLVSLKIDGVLESNSKSSKLILWSRSRLKKEQEASHRYNQNISSFFRFTTILLIRCHHPIPRYM